MLFETSLDYLLASIRTPVRTPKARTVIIMNAHMNWRRTLVTGALLSLLGMSAYGQAPLKIGLIGPFSGEYARWGTYAEQGMRLAIAEINANGGVHGSPLELVVGDDQFLPGNSIAVARRLIERDGIVASYGPLSTTTILAVIPIFAEARIPHIFNSFGAELTAQGSHYAFRAAPNNSEQNQVVIDYAVQCEGLRSFGIIADSGDYGRGNAVVYTEALAAHGLQPVSQQSFNVGDKDFTSQLLRIASAGADALILSTTDIDSALIARQVMSLGLDMRLIGNLSQDTGPYLEVGGIDATDGTIALSVSWVLEEQSEAIGQFRDSFTSKYGSEPESYISVWTYDDTYLFYEALIAAYPRTDGEAIADALHAMNGDQAVALLSGTYSFDETGEGFNGMKVLRVDQGVKTHITAGTCG